MNNKKCIICGKIVNKGINIKGEYICFCCEQKIVDCDTTNEDYNVYLNKIKEEIVQKHIV